MLTRPIGRTGMWLNFGIIALGLVLTVCLG
jgi:hypothetical protein